MRRQRGFTLIELLVVIAIIAILATLVITQLAGAQTKARNSNAKSDISQAGKAIETWKIDNSSDKVPDARIIVSSSDPGTKLDGVAGAVAGWSNLFSNSVSGFPIQLKSVPNASYTYGYVTTSTRTSAQNAIMTAANSDTYCIATKVVSGNNVADKGFAVTNGNSKTLGAEAPVYGNGTCS